MKSLLALLSVLARAARPSGSTSSRRFPVTIGGFRGWQLEGGPRRGSSAVRGKPIVFFLDADAPTIDSSFSPAAAKLLALLRFPKP